VWGGNAYGQTNIPAAATNVLTLDTESWGSGHLLALRGDGSLITWGRNDSGEATIPTTLADVVQIAAGQFHNLALYVDDLDNDGLAGSWERQYFGNTFQSPTGDYDNDGLSNLQEYLNHTDPTVAQRPTVAVWPQSQTVYS